MHYTQLDYLLQLKSDRRGNWVFKSKKEIIITLNSDICFTSKKRFQGTKIMKHKLTIFPHSSPLQGNLPSLPLRSLLRYILQIEFLASPEFFFQLSLSTLDNTLLHQFLKWYQCPYKKKKLMPQFYYNKEPCKIKLLDQTIFHLSLWWMSTQIIHFLLLFIVILLSQQTSYRFICNR